MEWFDTLLAWIGSLWDKVCSFFGRLWARVKSAFDRIVSTLRTYIEAFAPMFESMLKALLDQLADKHPIWASTLSVLYVKVKRHATLWFFNKRVELEAYAKDRNGQRVAHPDMVQQNGEIKPITIPMHELPPSYQTAILARREFETYQQIQ